MGSWRALDELKLDLCAESIDAAWDSLASQVVYGDTGVEYVTVDERFEVDARVKALRDELARVEARGRKERQAARKNALFDQVQELKRQIAAIEEGAAR